jgi:hypothetical protein
VPSFLVELTTAEGQERYAGPELRARLAGANDQQQKEQEPASADRPLLVSSATAQGVPSLGPSARGSTTAC